jgi:hypothetical protein
MAVDAILAQPDLAPTSRRSYVPRAPSGPDQVGFAVPLQLRTGGGALRLITTLTSFATASDVSLAELRLEAFLPADEESTGALNALARCRSR